MTLVEFLLAQIAEDEAVARAAIPGTYSPNADEDGSWRMIEVDHEGIWPEPASKPTSEWGHLADEPWALHIERHAPARVLAECKARRRIVEELVAADRAAATWDSDDPNNPPAYWQDWGNRHAWREAAELLALAYADHPDYRSEWSVS